MDDDDAADVDTDSYEVLSTHPFCRGLRKEVVLAISRASKRWVFTTPGRIIVQEGTVPGCKGLTKWEVSFEMGLPYIIPKWSILVLAQMVEKMVKKKQELQRAERPPKKTKPVFSLSRDSRARPSAKLF